MFHIVMGTKKVTNYVLEDIPIIVEEYNKLKTRREIYKFYQDYIEEPFTRLYENEKPTIPMMSETLRKVDPEMWEYIENRLNTAESQEQDIRFLLDELYASMVLSFDRYKENPIVYEYIPMLLQFVSQITTNIKVTDSYKIIYNLKPFHTEILDLARTKVIIDDKFNWLGFEDTYELFYLLVLADLLHMSDRLFFRFTPGNERSSSLGLITAIEPSYLYPFNVALRQDDHNIFHFHYPFSTDFDRKDHYWFEYILRWKPSTLFIKLRKNFSYLFPLYDRFLEKLKKFLKYLIPITSLKRCVVKDEKVFLINPNFKSTVLSLITEIEPHFNEKITSDELLINDNFNVKLSGEK